MPHPTQQPLDRRQLIRTALGAGAFTILAPKTPARPHQADSSSAAAPLAAAQTPESPEGPPFRISLAQWSLHRTLRSGELKNLDFARHTRIEFGIDAVEYVNQFFADRAGDFTYLGDMRQRATDAGVQSLLIMIDGEGALAAEDDGERRTAVENHIKWMAAARFLGCHSIRVNAAGSGDPKEMQKRAADSLVRLARLAEPYELNVIVENHGGLSSNGAWLAGVMRLADHPRVGTLPDFGNFQVGPLEWYDRYQGVTDLMPFAKAVSAKSHEFDDLGNEVHTDFERMLGIVLGAGYHGHVGIEYEGGKHSEADGIRMTRDLLQRICTAAGPARKR